MRWRNEEEGKALCVPAAQAGGPTETWQEEEEDRAGWSQPSAPGTTALNLPWTGETCQTETGEDTEEQQGETERAGEERQREETGEVRKHSKTAGRGETFVLNTLKSCN